MIFWIEELEGVWLLLKRGGGGVDFIRTGKELFVRRRHRKEQLRTLCFIGWR